MGGAGLFACAGGIAPSTAQAGNLDRFVYRQGHMGMEVRLVLYAPDRERSEKAARAAYDRVAAFDRLLSSYRSESELVQVNRKGRGKPVQVSPHLFTILEKAQTFARQSEGALDVTAGPLIQRWREARRTEQFPDSASLREAKRRVGWQNLALDDQAGTITFRRGGMELSLGGLAKGYILDRALEVLDEHGISRALVEAGGDLSAGASPPGQEGWTVDVPHRLAGDASTVLAVTHSAVATSGDAVQYVEIGNERYSHVINPKTGIGLTDQPTTTVVAPSGVVADGLATTVGVLGHKKGRPFVRSHYPHTTTYVTTSESTHVLQVHGEETSNTDLSRRGC